MGFLNKLKPQVAALHSQQLIPLENPEANADGFGVPITPRPVAGIHCNRMDKPAQLVVAQPSRFL